MSIFVSYEIENLGRQMYVFLIALLIYFFSCFTTEILDGFDVQRTTGFADTQRRYVDLTHSIIAYYDASFSKAVETFHICPTYDEFKRKCIDLTKTTVNDIFALQLMQVIWQCFMKVSRVVHSMP